MYLTAMLSSTEVERAHEEVKVQLTEKFQISENLLKVTVATI